MFVSDERLRVKVEEAVKDPEPMIEKLDEMLTASGVQHFFSEPIEVLDDEEYILDLFYDSNDRVTVDLIYLLWAKTIRNVPNEKIVEAMKRVAA